MVLLIAWWCMTRQNSRLVCQCRWQRGCIRSRWLRTSWEQAIPLVKVDDLRASLEENQLKLTHSSHLANYIPLLLKQEKETLKNEIQGVPVSVVFNGTTREGESLAIVVRFVRDWQIELLGTMSYTRTLVRHFLFVSCILLCVMLLNVM